MTLLKLNQIYKEGIQISQRGKGRGEESDRKSKEEQEGENKGGRDIDR